MKGLVADLGASRPLCSVMQDRQVRVRGCQGFPEWQPQYPSDKDVLRTEGLPWASTRQFFVTSCIICSHSFTCFHAADLRRPIKERELIGRKVLSKRDGRSVFGFGPSSPTSRSTARLNGSPWQAGYGAVGWGFGWDGQFCLCFVLFLLDSEGQHRLHEMEARMQSPDLPSKTFERCIAQRSVCTQQMQRALQSMAL